MRIRSADPTHHPPEETYLSRGITAAWNARNVVKMNNGASQGEQRGGECGSSRKADEWGMDKGGGGGGIGRMNRRNGWM